MISVIIPIYNRAHTIRRAVDSVLRQTYRDLELLLVDDGSTDDTLAICREYERQDSRVKVFHTDNRGVSAARNLALRHCAGQYVRFLDSDDELPENSLADLIAPFQNNEAVELVMGAMLGYGYETPPAFSTACDPAGSSAALHATRVSEPLLLPHQQALSSLRAGKSVSGV